MLTCRTCQTEKPEDSFWRQASKVSGRQSECKDCQTQRNRKWHQNNPAKARENGKRGSKAKRLRNPRKALFMAAKARAAKRGMKFTITLDDLTFPERCPILGIPMSFGLGGGMSMGLAVRDTRYSIDRIDNSKGYIPGNVIVVSYRANRLKSDARISELREIVRFYDELAAKSCGQASLSAVQPHPEKQERQVLKRVA